MQKRKFVEGSLALKQPFRASRHPHIPGMWCYRQNDTAYAHLRVGPYFFTEYGDAVCAVSDVVDVKPGDVLAFLEDGGFISSEVGVVLEGIPAAIEHFGGSVIPVGESAYCPDISPMALETLEAHLSSTLPAVLCLGDRSNGGHVVAAAGFDAERSEVLLFSPQGSEQDGWYPWQWIADTTTAFVLAIAPEIDRYTPRSIFKQIYGIDIAGHEQRWPDIDLESLRAINPGCIGWIHLGGTPISYPIVEDHFDSRYYQTHNFSGEPSVHGAVSLSFANGGSFDSPNLVFSAHRMRDYSMFKMLTFYDREDFSSEHPYIDLLLGNVHYRARVFSAYHFPKRRDESSCVDFEGIDEFQHWTRQRIAQSMHPFPVMSQIDKVATFRTCYGLNNDETFVLHAVLGPA